VSIGFDGKRICGVKDHIGNADCAWPFLDVTVYAEGMIGQISLRDAAEWAIQGWNDVCGIRMTMTANPKTAHIVTGPVRIDGPNNILAQCELPCGFLANRWRQLRCEVDSSEAFVLSTNPPANRIDVGRTLRHEYGHGLGVGHIETGNLMAAIYSSSIYLPQNGDIIQVRARYGKPQASAPKPTIPSIPVPTPGDKPAGGTVKELIPCLLKYGGDLLSELTPEERRALIRTAINFWRGMSAEQKLELQNATESLRA
jgi:hypothetical protein